MQEALYPHAATHLPVLLTHVPTLSSMLTVSSRYPYFQFLHWTTHNQAALVAVLRIYQAPREVLYLEVHPPLKAAMPQTIEATAVARVLELL